MEIKRLITKPLLLVLVGMMMKRYRFKKDQVGKNQIEALATGMREMGGSRMTSRPQLMANRCPRQVTQEDKSMQSFKNVSAPGQELICYCLAKEEMEGRGKRNENEFYL